MCSACARLGARRPRDQLGARVRQARPAARQQRVEHRAVKAGTQVGLAQEALRHDVGEVRDGLALCQDDARDADRRFGCGEFQARGLVFRRFPLCDDHFAHVDVQRRRAAPSARCFRAPPARLRAPAVARRRTCPRRAAARSRLLPPAPAAPRAASAARCPAAAASSGSEGNRSPATYSPPCSRLRSASMAWM